MGMLRGGKTLGKASIVDWVLLSFDENYRIAFHGAILGERRSSAKAEMRLVR
jgi:hypothetical protein